MTHNAAPRDGRERVEPRPGVCSENLVSFVVISSDDLDRDVAALQNMCRMAEGRFDFYEVLFVIGNVDRETTDRLRARVAGLRNLRIIVMNMASGFDALLSQGLVTAIGDYVAAVYAGETTPEWMAHLVEVCAEEQRDVVRGLRAPVPEKGFDRLRARLLRWMLRQIVGREVETLQSRALCVSRQALARLIEHSALGYFRLVQMDDVFDERKIVVDSDRRGGGGSETWRRVRILARLAALRTPQILILLAIVLACASAVGALYGIYAIGVALVRENLAEGWLSTSLLISFLTMSMLGALAAICLSVSQMMSSTRPSGTDVVVQDYSNTDLFEKSLRLNVEIDRKT